MRLAIVGSALILAAWSAVAMAATCTITDAHEFVKEGPYDRPLPDMVGYAIPVDITASTGAFHEDLSGVPVGNFNIVVDNSISIAPAGAITGTIDRGGNVAFPPIVVDFRTALTPETLHATLVLSTGLAGVTLFGNDYVTMGTPLDFPTGVLRLEGIGVVLNAPVVGQSTTGVSIDCTLAPVPSATTLPKAPKLALHGTGRPGASGAGDSVALKAKIKNGIAAADLTKDLLLRIALGDTEALLVRVPAGSLKQSGKKFTASDGDGTIVHVVTGQKMGATVSGSIVVVQSKKGLVLTLSESGLDLSALGAGGTATATLSIGGFTATDAVTVKPGAKKIALK